MQDCSVRVWDIREHKAVKCFLFPDDITTIRSHGGDTVIFAAYKDSVLSLDLRAGGIICRPDESSLFYKSSSPSADCELSAMELSTDGAMLAVGDG